MTHSHSALGSGTTSGGGGCGCGGSGGGGCGCGGGGCSCGSQECQDCKTTAVVRPRFFAGQLLTEDDLEALTNYVVAKQRLHTRHLHGAGVVCGLEVVCDPCDPANVVVKPGYALDCCGNDIVVECATTLDVIAMVRRLLADTRKGHDCGDPCAERPKLRPEPAAVEVPQRAGPGEIQVSLAYQARKKPEPDARPIKYCLYVSYCEHPSDPVAPYVLDEPCGNGSCEHTRVREGYRFELRCVEDHKPAATALQTFEACADLKELLKEIQGAGKRIIRAGDAIGSILAARRNDPITLPADDVERLRRAAAVVERFTATAEAPDATPRESDLRQALDAFLDLARVIAQAVTVRETGGAVPAATLEQMKRARVVLAGAEPILRRHVNVFDQRDDQLMAQAVLDQAVYWSLGDVPVDTRTSVAARLFLGGTVFSRELARFDAQHLAQLKDWLLRRAESAIHGDCRLRADIKAIAVDIDPDAPEALEAARTQMERALERFVAACLCHAILPPCPPCDDSAVLLACLTLEDCEVVSVCNLERTFVLSWPTMRYWMPWFSDIGNAFEALCCPDPKKDAARQLEPQAYILPAAGTGRVRTPFAMAHEAQRHFEERSSLANTLRFAVKAPESSGTVSRLTQLLDQSIIPPHGELPRVLDEALTPGGEQLADALRSAEPRRTVTEIVDDRVEQLRPTADLKAVSDATDERFAQVATDLMTLRRDVKKRATTTEVAVPMRRITSLQTTVAQTGQKIESINQKLIDQLAELTRRLELLEANKNHA